MTKRKNFGADVDVADVESEVANAGAEVAALAAEVAALKKEVADLKEQIAKKSSGGSDERLDKVVEIIKSHKIFKERVEKVNL